ncbi:peptidoglycan editing factor PgeF [Fibrella forsythiae]|uniref:Purine nucleoside phosphorylase n=1 Tax=Fibrella forsythiae TaxID=2817061 RepID=A0ABS3JEC0_9BACT|nr:peptidoglycan editing factor PgeF [Fibrella forsythiae]MBO0947624.1 peptidoglycan editing factor PgeF [Fibrella forsythiae]
MQTASFRTPSIFTPFLNLIAAESTRHGGVSQPPYSSMNLGINTDDEPANVAENRRLWLANWQLDESNLASSYQVHGTAVQVATAAGRTTGYDALITNVPGLVVGVTVADCTPILVYDVRNRAVAAIHAGWRGTVGGIVTKTLGMMQETYGTTSADCRAYVGTCIDACSFEVGHEVATQFNENYITTNPSTGKSMVDLKQANTDQLRDFGLSDTQIELSPYSTVLNNTDYFSHRLEQGFTGRMLAIIGIR